MNHLNFLISGAAATQYQRTAYIEDQINRHSAGECQGTIINDYTENQNERLAIIDGALSVRTVATETLQNAQRFWVQQEKLCNLGKSVCFIAGGATLLYAIGMGVVIPPLWPLALTIGGIGLAALALSVRLKMLAQKAVTERAQWKDTVEEVRVHRKKMGEEGSGFHYARTQNFNPTIINQKELKMIWERDYLYWMRTFSSSDFSDEVFIENMNTMMEQDFFGEETLRTAGIYDTDRPSSHTIEYFKALRSDFISKTREIDREKREVETKYQRQSLENTANKTRRIAEASRLLRREEVWDNLYFLRPRVTLIVVGGGRTREDVKNTLILWTALTILEFAFVYLQYKMKERRLAAPIEREYRELQQEINNRKGRSLESLEDDRRQFTLQFKEPMKVFFETYRTEGEEVQEFANLLYSEQEFEPSAPYEEVVFNSYVPYDPSLQGYVSEQDWSQWQGYPAGT